MPILLASLAAAALLMLEHYILLPYWRHVRGVEMPTLARYVSGVAVLQGTLIVLYAVAPSTNPIAATLTVTLSGGLAVFTAYGADWTIERIADWRESQVRQ